MLTAQQIIEVLLANHLPAAREVGRVRREKGGFELEDNFYSAGCVYGIYGKDDLTDAESVHDRPIAVARSSQCSVV